MSALLEEYYASRDTVTRIRQKSSDLRRIVQTALERNNKKYDLQLKQLKDTEKREKYRIYGELLEHLRLRAHRAARSPLHCLNYYTNEEITIPLDSQLSAKDNAKKHFDKYNKLKRTYEALTDLTKETKAEIDHLESISSALDIALSGKRPGADQGRADGIRLHQETPFQRQKAQDHQQALPLHFFRRLSHVCGQEQLPE
ncbi:MAG: NFACT family protein [Enterocloster sp.]